MTQSSQTLSGLRVLVTRPVHQQNNFCHHLRQEGAKPISFPLLEITAPNNTDNVSQSLQSTDSADYVIFVSPNAVSFAHNLRPLPWSDVEARFAAVGEITAAKLNDYGQAVDLIPRGVYSSSALLELEELQDLHGKNIVIICGDNSRPLLNNELTKRGARVEAIEVYHNQIPLNGQVQLKQIILEKNPQVICITSNQGILNLLKIMDETCRNQVLMTPLIVNSDRCSKLARDSGFMADITVAEPAGDNGQLNALKRWYSTSIFNHSE